jgi:ubiquinone/menaquinone biosynthesis C-methylase UbiE
MTERTHSQELRAQDSTPGPEVVPTASGYDRWSEVYDSDENPLILLEEKHMPPLVGNVAGLKVADIGCGTGRHALRLAGAGADVTAVDFSREMLSRARSKPGAERVQFIQHDITKRLPLESASFDRVFCCLVLDHISDVNSFLSELGRLRRPGGFVVISVMHPAMMLKGVQARFTDPTSGRKVSPQSYPNQVSDYVRAAVQAGLTIDYISEHAIDPELAKRSERAAEYLDWPMLLLMRLK